MKTGVIFIAEQGIDHHHGFTRMAMIDYANSINIDVLKSFTAPVCTNGEYEDGYLDKCFNMIDEYNDKAPLDEKIRYFISSRIDVLSDFGDVDDILDAFEARGIVVKTLN